MASIPQNDHQDKVVSASIYTFFKTYRIGSLLKAANAYKTKGIAAVRIFLALFSTIFLHRSIYMNLLMSRCSNGFGKDTIYRFMKSTHINWIRFTSLLSARIASESIEYLTSDERINVLIVDDSMFERARSKKVELLAKVFDHAKGIYTNGFRMLTLCWSDGNTVLPVNGCLLSTENAKNRLTKAEDLDKRTVGFKRRQLAQTKAPKVMLELLKEAKTAGIHASHVLFDTWFCSPSSLLTVNELGYNVIAMAKKTSKVHYLHNGQMKSVTEIYKQSRKRCGRSKYLLSATISVVKEGDCIPARLVYVRNRNKKKEYLVLITTDMDLSEEEIIRIYGKRWGIEVFFKFCKSYLKLSKECNSLSYDAMTAHVAIVFTRYMMLAVENRQTADERTLGEMFYLCTDEMADITWIEAFHLIMQLLQEFLTDDLALTEKVVKKFINIFLSKLPQILVEKLKLCVRDVAI
jgi:hypothetical protein